MGRVPMPQQDAGERELPPQGPHWRAGGPATLRVLILALLCRGSLAQPPGFTLTVPQSVSVQEGLCILVPCTFTHPASYNTDNPSAQLYGQWFKEPATVGQDPPVASSGTSLGVSQETQGRFWLKGDRARGDCSLHISDARRTDAGRYFFYIEKGLLEHTYCSNSDGADPALMISVPGLTEKPEIQFSPARGLPGTLLAGEPVTVTCTAPGRCSGPPPRVTWTGPFNDSAWNVSAQLVNGTWAHRSALNFTPGPGDHGKELVCNVTYRPPWGPSTHRTVWLHVDYPPGPPNITGNLTRNGRPVPDAWGAEGDVVSLETQEGDSMSLSCEAGSRPEVTLSWAKGNESLSPGQGGAGHLELPNLSRGDAGEYRCWAKNSYGSASRALRVHVQYPPGPPSITGTLTRNRRPDPTRPPSITGTLTRNGRPAPLRTLQITVSRANRRDPQLFQDSEKPDKWMIIGVTCGLGVLIGLFLLGLYVIKLRGREPVPRSAKAGEMANGSLVEHTANEANVIYSTVTRIPMHHKTPAAHRTKGVQDGAAAPQGPLGPGEPEELHYASVGFSKLQSKGGEPCEAPATEYSEVRRK